MSKKVVSILIDNPNSWIVPFGKVLLEKVKSMDFDVTLVHSQEDIPNGFTSFYLGCEKIVKPKNLKKNTHNIVVHPSDLPKGRGFSPLAWQIEEGCNKICLTLFEAVEGVDAGPFYLKDWLSFDGTELNDEIKLKQGLKTVELCERFLKEMPAPIDQEGEPTFYERRTKKSSELDPTKSIEEQFEKFRVVDNERYPAFFYLRDEKYILKIYKEEV